MGELMSALCAMHEVGIVHRDIKPENLIVANVEDIECASLVVIDFGYAALLDGPDSLTGLAGSPEYAAPEVLSWLEAELNSEVEGQPYSTACDVWSCGVTAHILLCAELHFDVPEGTDDDEIALVAAARDSELKFNQPEWESFPTAEDAKDFIRACMQVSQGARMTAAAALEHPWLRGRPPTSASAEQPVAAPATAPPQSDAALQSDVTLDAALQSDVTSDVTLQSDVTSDAALQSDVTSDGASMAEQATSGAASDTEATGC